MRESKFISQNAEKWKAYEEGLTSGDLGPEQLEKAFIELNDDLAYSRTFYRNRSVRVFLNNLLSPVYDRIYSRRTAGKKRILSFFTETAPRIHYQARYYMLVSFITVMLGFLMGYFGTRHDAGFANTVLGNGYVHMTEENIAKGDPMGVYKHMDPETMFFEIATNNLQVAFYFFLFGALLCVGTLYLLTVNGIVLGAFTYLFTSRGLTTEYLMTVYQHGTLEILTMVIEGAAGLMMGAGFLFPGTLSRIQSIQNAARKSITMFLVCVPIIITAAFIESYLTRFTEISNALRALIIAFSLLFMLFYFVVLPWWKFRHSTDLDLQEEQPRPLEEKPFKTGEMYTVGEIFLFAIARLRSSFTAWTLTSVALGLALYALVAWLGDHALAGDVKYEFRRWIISLEKLELDNLADALSASSKLILWMIFSSRYVFNTALFPEVLLSVWLMWTAVLLITVRSNGQLMAAGVPAWRIWYQAPLLALLPALSLQLFGGAWWLALWVMWPLTMKAVGLAWAWHNGNLLMGLRSAFSLLFRQSVRFTGGILVVLVIYFMISLGIWMLITVIISFTANMHETTPVSPEVLLFYVRVNYALWPLLLLAGGYFFLLNGLTMYERQTGTFLLRKVEDISFRKEVYGVETE